MNEKIIDGILITEDENGNKHFTPIDTPKKQESENEDVGFFRRIGKWFKNLIVKPYVKIRDTADPLNTRDEFDTDKGSDGKPGIEVGVKVEF